MARQRYRVWVARLIAATAVAVLVMIAAKTLWNRWLAAEGRSGKPKMQIASSAEMQEAVASHALDPVLQLAHAALAQHRQRDRDYCATVTKRERISGKLGVVNRMELKLRNRTRSDHSDGSQGIDPDASAKALASDPRSEVQPSRLRDVYLKFAEPKSLQGREAIWREGVNGNVMVVHETGFLNIARIPLAPTSPLAMAGNRYPISDIGLEKLLEKLIEKGERDRLLGGCDVEIIEHVQVAGKDCQRIVVTHSEQETEWEGKAILHEFYRAIIDIDVEKNLPIHYASYLWPSKPGEEPLLDEEYTYADLQLNCDLSDLDFDPDNEKYAFPK
ncbi:MAG: DUF1571 domain-containing protein [Planctomycetes bacterium]|nr:DUF1571 domain-containing protein [Planctomycetota bacterium]